MQNVLDADALGSVLPTFQETLERHGLRLERGRTNSLQVNVGYLCNQACRHCHHVAGPSRKEIMSAETIEEVIAYAMRADFKTIDITGGAPEMIPGICRLIEGLAPLTERLILRSNLTAIAEPGKSALLSLCKAKLVTIIASLPSTNAGQTDAQRGRGTMEKSLETLRWLNSAGYGQLGTGLELNLAVNPGGAYLSAPQEQVERKFRHDLERRWEIVFSSLLAFSNMPLGRFRDWLIQSGNFAAYMEKLTSGFNPSTIEGLMCRSTVSVSWDGFLYDCDFNLAQGLSLGGSPRHVSQLDAPPDAGMPIATGDHCYACSAGSGFTCSGAVAA